MVTWRDYTALLAERDAARAELTIVREQYATYRECAGASIAANLDEKLLEQLSESDAQLSQARAELKEAVQLLRTVNKSYWQSPEGDPALLNAIENIGPFLDRVGKQPSGEE